MITMREAQQRASVLGGYIKRTVGAEVRVGLHSWSRHERDAKEYFTDDLLDAVISLGKMH